MVMTPNLWNLPPCFAFPHTLKVLVDPPTTTFKNDPNQNYMPSSLNCLKYPIHVTLLSPQISGLQKLLIFCRKWGQEVTTSQCGTPEFLILKCNYSKLIYWPCLVDSPIGVRRCCYVTLAMLPRPSKVFLTRPILPPLNPSMTRH